MKAKREEEKSRRRRRKKKKKKEKVWILVWIYDFENGKYGS